VGRLEQRPIEAVDHLLGAPQHPSGQPPKTRLPHRVVDQILYRISHRSQDPKGRGPPPQWMQQRRVEELEDLFVDRAADHLPQ